jgi:hypothetical protein
VVPQKAVQPPYTVEKSGELVVEDRQSCLSVFAVIASTTQATATG